MKRILLTFIISTFAFTATLYAEEPIIIKMGSVIGGGADGRMPLHSGKIQEQFARMVSEYTNGEVIWQNL